MPSYHPLAPQLIFYVFHIAIRSTHTLRSQGVLNLQTEMDTSDDSLVKKQLRASFFERQKCHVCGKLLKYGTDLNRHILRHFRPKPHSCEFSGCKFRCSYLSNLKIHLRIHSNVKPEICPEPDCSFTTRNSGSLTYHRKRKHGYVPRDRFANPELKTARMRLAQYLNIENSLPAPDQAVSRSPKVKMEECETDPKPNPNKDLVALVPSDSQFYQPYSQTHSQSHVPSVFGQAPPYLTTHPSSSTAWYSQRRYCALSPSAYTSNTLNFDFSSSMMAGYPQLNVNSNFKIPLHNSNVMLPAYQAGLSPGASSYDSVNTPYPFGHASSGFGSLFGGFGASIGNSGWLNSQFRPQLQGPMDPLFPAFYDGPSNTINGTNFASGSGSVSGSGSQVEFESTTTSQVPSIPAPENDDSDCNQQGPSADLNFSAEPSGIPASSPQFPQHFGESGVELATAWGIETLCAEDTLNATSDSSVDLSGSSSFFSLPALDPLPGWEGLGMSSQATGFNNCSSYDMSQPLLPPAPSSSS
ncbi:hypothetical protein K435DRAFT_833259 [Dendrothele bispora CBS 962.96]|uniref:C2H2-type domain-containing protein n=1 Tax=Dendrothele bispora (strain CBS 962.96) TaxID=1314807 RepID=A0A4V4HIT9_DENBC|nr:hypothetical protein K435DRAFT_833259 [Dendrothele bispora CBS 962.96]